MATKGQKNGTGKPAAPKAAARAKPAPKPKPAAAKAEKPEPEVKAEIVAPPAPEPVPAEAAPQEVIETVAETAAEEIVEVAQAAAEPVETVTEEITEAAAPVAAAASAKEETIMETNFAKAQALFADWNDRTKAAVEKSTKMVEEANDFAKGNLEALVESGKITAKGLESFGQDAAEFSRKSFESATAALKGMASVKSPTELFKLQSDFFRTAFDSMVAETSKNTEAMIKLAGDAAQPLSNRVAVAADKAKLAA